MNTNKAYHVHPQEIARRHRVWKIQSQWNDDLTRERRLDLMLRFEGRLNRLFRSLGLTVTCNDCYRLYHEYEIDETPEGFQCPECHSTDLDAGGGCPMNHVREQDDE